MNPEHDESCDESLMVPQTFPNSLDLRANSVSLLLCWHIRIGLFREIENSRMQAYCRFFYEEYLGPYMLRIEKRLEASGLTGAGSIRKLTAQHDRLRLLFENPVDRRKLKSLEDKLEAYTWYEHRVLHLALLNKLSGGEFQRFIGDEAGHVKTFHNRLNSWHDKYWELR